MLFSVVFAVQRHPLFCFSDFIAIRHFAVGRRITQGPGLPDPRPRATGPAGPMLSEMHRGARRRALVGVAVVDRRQWTSSLPRPSPSRPPLPYPRSHPLDGVAVMDVFFSSLRPFPQEVKRRPSWPRLRRHCRRSKFRAYAGAGAAAKSTSNNLQCCDLEK